MNITLFRLYLPKTAVISTSIALSLISQHSLASEKKQDTKPAIEEVLVIGKKTAAPTEIAPETQKLLSVAGAANDPLQAIYALPGVTFSSSDGPGGSDPVIRGSAPQDNAYFVDLIPADYIFHIFGNSIFDEHVIHSFELYPAAFSSKYGNATGGIIDVTLREPKNQDFTTTLHTSVLSSGAHVESGMGENHAFYATYRRSMLDLLIAPEDISDDDDEGIKINQLPISDDYQFKYSGQLDKNNRITVVAAGASDSIAATFNENFEEVARDPDFAGPASIEQGFDSQGIIWNWNNNDQALTSIFSHTGGHNDLIYGKNQHQKTQTDRYLGRFLYTQALNKTHSLATGLSLSDISYNLDFNAKIVACNDLDPECATVDADYVLYKNILNVLAYEFYVEDQWAITNQHSVNFGANFSSDDYLSEGRLEPRLRWNYQINNAFKTYVSAGQYSQLPQLREMIDVLGNPNLTTVKSDHFVWGISQTLNNGWRWNTDIYYKNMTDVVLSVEQNSTQQDSTQQDSTEQDSTAKNYSNGAEGNAYGVEFLVNKDLTDKWYGWAALSLSETDRTISATGKTVKFEYDKPILFNLVLNRLVGQHWMLGFKWNYQSGGRYTPVIDLIPSSKNPSVLEPVYGALNSEQYPDYHRLDFRAEYTSPKKWGYWKFYTDIINVYNRENVQSYEYAPTGKKLIPPPPGYGKHVPVTEELGDGLIPSIGFEIQF
ncbi:MAG: hypothetical protein RL497_1900 [Pseudomonadota bacterium]|jgi:hypothetical protein